MLWALFLRHSFMKTKILHFDKTNGNILELKYFAWFFSSPSTVGWLLLWFSKPVKLFRFYEMSTAFKLTRQLLHKCWFPFPSLLTPILFLFRPKHQMGIENEICTFFLPSTMSSIIAWSISDRTKTKTTMEKNGIHNAMPMYANVHNAGLKFSLKLRRMPIKME